MDLRNELERLIMTVFRRPKPLLLQFPALPAILTLPGIDVAVNLFVRWINTIIQARPSQILVLLDAMNRAFENPPVEFGGWESFLDLLRKLYKSTTAPPEACFVMSQVDVKLIRGRHKVTDLHLASGTFDEFLEPPVRQIIALIARWLKELQRVKLHSEAGGQQAKGYTAKFVSNYRFNDLDGLKISNLNSVVQRSLVRNDI